jgi:hypothetical protein
VAGGLSSWLERVTCKLPVTAEFLSAGDALLEVMDDSIWTDTGEAFTTALSSPIGQTLVLLNLWLAASLKRASSLQPEVRIRIERLLAKAQPQLRRARIVIAANLCALHFVDTSWVRAKLIPLFAWDKNAALEMWQGYLANHHWYPDLLADLKPIVILITLANRNQLAESAKGLWRLLAGIMAYSPSNLSDQELTGGFQSLDKTPWHRSRPASRR